MTTLVDQVAAARRHLRYTIAHPGEWPLGVAGRLADEQSRYLRELEDMECCTRFMPLTRLSLDTDTLQPGVAEEVEKHISRLRANNKPFVADHRQQRLHLFQVNPSINTLRAIWLLHGDPK